MAAVNNVSWLHLLSITYYNTVRFDPSTSSYIEAQTVTCEDPLVSSSNFSLVLLRRSTHVNNSPFHRPSETGTSIPRDKTTFGRI